MINNLLSNYGVAVALLGGTFSSCILFGFRIRLFWTLYFRFVLGSSALGLALFVMVKTYKQGLGPRKQFYKIFYAIHNGLQNIEPYLFKSAIIGVGISVFILVVFRKVLFKKLESAHGDARFCTPSEEKEVLKKNNEGLLIDGKRRLSGPLSCQHLMVVAPTG